MPNENPFNPFEYAKQELGGLRKDVLRMLELRWALARTELRRSLAATQRLLAWLIASAALLLAVVPLLGVVAAEKLAGRWQISKLGWLAILAGAFFAVGALIAWLAWRQFRRRYHGLEQSLEELREDAVWMQDLFERRDS
jgi:hypothetical protein